MTKLYARPLSKGQIDSGIRVCFEYANRLRRIVSAIASIERGLAFSLACIRVEELSKILLLIEMISGRHDTTSWSRFWQKFRSHQAKWRAYGKWRFQSQGLTDKEATEELARVFQEWASAKNTGLYVEYDPSIGFVQPGLVPDFLASALKMGDELNKEIKSMLTDTRQVRMTKRPKRGS